MPISFSDALFLFPWARNIIYMHGDQKISKCRTSNKQQSGHPHHRKLVRNYKGATKLSKEFMLVSHKSYLSLVSSAASWTWWNGPLKCSQSNQHFKGFSEPAPLPCITRGQAERRGPKRNEKRTQETASKRENTPKLKCKRVIGAEMSRETLTEKKKLKMKEHGVQRNVFILSWSSHQMR